MGKYSPRVERSRSSNLANLESSSNKRPKLPATRLKTSVSKTAKKKFKNPERRDGSNLKSLKSLVYNNPYNGRYANIYGTEDQKENPRKDNIGPLKGHRSKDHSKKKSQSRGKNPGALEIRRRKLKSREPRKHSLKSRKGSSLKKSPKKSQNSGSMKSTVLNKSLGIKDNTSTPSLKVDLNPRSEN